MTAQIHTTRIDPKRRTGVLPADVLAAANIGPDVELIVTAEGEGRLVLETRSALIARIRAEHGRGLTRSFRQYRADEVDAEAGREQTSA